MTWSSCQWVLTRWLTGLSVIRRLVKLDVPFLALEHGGAQADAIEALARAAGFDQIERIRDLAGIERVLVARR